MTAPPDRQGFSDLVGTDLDVDEAAGVALQVTEVTSHGDDGTTSGYQGFSVLFEGPAEPILPQRTYTLRPAGGEGFPVFVVPLGPTGAGTCRYEAVFNRAV